MGRKFWGGLGLLAGMLAGVGAAGAADLAVKAPVYKAPPPVVKDWSGFYLGINGGYGWGDTKVDSIFGYDVPGFSPKGGLFGGHAGYNWQYGPVVAGVEVDFDGADIKETKYGYVTAKFDELATARARLGYIVLPDLLAYGTAGAAWGHSKGSIGDFEANANNFGWAAGAGLEYHLGHGFIARAEYLHYDFAKTAYSFPILVSPNASTAIDAVRGGLSYKF